MDSICARAYIHDYCREYTSYKHIWNRYVHIASLQFRSFPWCLNTTTNVYLPCKSKKICANENTIIIYSLGPAKTLKNQTNDLGEVKNLKPTGKQIDEILSLGVKHPCRTVENHAGLLVTSHQFIKQKCQDAPILDHLLKWARIHTNAPRSSTWGSSILKLYLLFAFDANN